MLPAGSAAAIDAILEDPLADHMKPAQLLRIDVQQLTRPLTLITTDRVTLGPWQARTTPATQHLPDRRGRPARDRRDHHRPRQRALPNRDDLPLLRIRQPPR